jgi:ADP-ribose pyrophosphatase YjhB (NUDIX family)
LDCSQHTLVAHVAVLHHSSALLVKYKTGYDQQPGWFLPNDGLHHLEHPDQAAKRILKDQLAISDASTKMVEVESFAGNDQSWHLIFDYLAFPRSMNVTPGPSVLEAKWFEIDKLPTAETFAHHGWGRSVLVKHALPTAQAVSTR